MPAEVGVGVDAAFGQQDLGDFEARMNSGRQVIEVLASV